MLNLSDLPIHSIILAPTHMHSFLNQTLLSQSNGKIGIRFYSITSYIQSQSLVQLPSSEAILFAYRNKIKELSTNLAIYKEAALTPAFLKQCYQFIQDLKIWNISPQSLQEDTPSNKELKTIILSLYPITTSGNILHSNEVLLQHKSASHIYIYPSLFSCEEKKWVDLLLSNGAHMLDDTMENISSSFYHALNKRQEIEGCAQYIIQHQLDAQEVALTTVVGTTLFAQYLGQNNETKVKEVINMRILFAVGISLIFALPTWITPKGMVKLISGFDDNLSLDIINKSSSYILIITAS